MYILLRRTRPLSWFFAAPGTSICSGRKSARLTVASSSIIATRQFGTVSIILKEDLEGRGYKGEEVMVRGGYMRNYLFPTKKAVYATEENKKLYHSVQKTEDTEKINALKALKRGRKTLSNVPITFKRHVTRPGAPTREVTAQNVSDYLLKARRLDIPAENIAMEPITSLGVHNLRVQVAFPPEIREMLQKDLGASEYEEQSWVDKTLTIVKR